MNLKFDTDLLRQKDINLQFLLQEDSIKKLELRNRMDQHQTPKNKDTEENTAYEDELHQPFDMVCQIITEHKHISAINPARNSVLQVQHEPNLALQHQPSLIYQLRPREFYVVVRIFDTKHVQWHSTKQDLRL